MINIQLTDEERDFLKDVWKFVEIKWVDFFEHSKRPLYDGLLYHSMEFRSRDDNQCADMLLKSWERYKGENNDQSL